MSFSREELLYKDFLLQQRITQELIDKLDANQKLTIAEARHICGKLKLFRNERDENIDALKYSQCNDCIFQDKYLLYINNHEGWGDAYDFDGKINQSQKRKDAEFLNQHFLSWEETVIKNLRLTDEIKRHIAIETNRQIKSLKSYCTQMHFGSNHFNFLRKGLILHSKFLYLTVLEYYDEGNSKEDIVNICNHKFVIDSYVYIHVLFRHFAETVMEHQQKSYHTIKHFEHKNLPKQILEMLKNYSLVVDCNSFDKEKLFFKLDDTHFALWFKEIEFNKKGKSKERVIQLQTLYPVELRHDFEKIKNLTPIKFDSTLWFYF
ncbi:hypothetical protein [Pedobacter cryophilus]|uniref:Uncharacterized protein n=1 Tax=Pedobacter cryophilus TaxID=2571271 RepID=A0A4U1BX10_9SPHI|nr:hypothetical protein [Pedobacter cryophilus]TKB95736.1 hypothetical protein FA046_15710 [Pedobacter cryophilus]